MKCRLVEDLIEDAGISFNVDDENSKNNVFEISTFHLLCALNFELAVNYVECEEVPTGQEYLDKCLQTVMKERELELFCITVNNQYGIAWSNGCSYEKAYNYLKVSEKLYTRIIKNLKLKHTLTTKSFLIAESPQQGNNIEENSNLFESLHTHTYYLAQAYGIRGDTKASSKYRHVTLARQISTKKYEPLDWSL